MVRELLRSKFSHSQFAMRCLFSVLLSDWKSLLLSYYTMNSDNVLKDMYDPEKELPSSTVQTLSNLWIDLLNTVVDNTTSDVLPFLMSEEFFCKLLTEIRKKPKPTNSLVSLCRVFEKLCERCDFLKILVQRTEKKGKYLSSLSKSKEHHPKDTPTPRPKSRKEIQVSESDIDDLLQVITHLTSIPGSHSANCRAFLTGSLRYLFRTKVLFEYQKNDSAFYFKLLSLCRDPHKAVSKESWKLFYNILTYHSGVIDILEKHKLLIQFFDILGLNSPGNVVIINTLHCIAKVFGMFSKEQRRYLTTGRTKREDLKAVEKDVKQFISFFKHRHLFIKPHMIYKRFSESQPGAAYLELANLYHVIETLPECKKLLADIQKFPDYKLGMEKVTTMFAGSF